VPADALRKDERTDRGYRVLFRLPVPAASARAELLWKHRLLAEVPLPVLTPDEFLANVRVATPTLTVRVGDRAVAAQTFVALQCRGLTLAGVLRSPTSLAPLADLGLRAVFRSERFGTVAEVPVALAGSQLAAREALVTAAPPRWPRRSGRLTAAWVAGDRELAAVRAEAVTGARFVQSLRVADARLVAADKGGAVRVCRHPPQLRSPAAADPAPAAGVGPDACRVGPCFVLHSREPGMAGLVTLRAVAQQPGAERPAAFEAPVLVTDGPTVFAPGLLDAADLAGVGGFELRHKGTVLGVVSMNPVPTAAFTSEGGFKPPAEFAWTPTADEELTDRLTRLMKDDPGK
jgi:hypothetical protein